MMVVPQNSSPANLEAIGFSVGIPLPRSVFYRGGKGFGFDP